jgi:hypothetical protein
VHFLRLVAVVATEIYETALLSPFVSAIPVVASNSRAPILLQTNLRRWNHLGLDQAAVSRNTTLLSFAPMPARRPIKAAYVPHSYLL